MSAWVAQSGARAFSKRVVVSSDDIDMLGHASNISFVRWIQDVAMEHSRAMGLGLAEYQGIGAVFVVRRHEVDYLRPARLGEEIELRTWVGLTRAASCERHTEIARVTEGEILAEAVTTWAFVDAQTGRPTRIPPDVRARFGVL
jgi:acyl-CoA thioester hydrolase